MINHELRREDGILIITPEGRLQSDDFEKLSQVVDEYITESGALTGVMIYVESFPGWEDFGALISHLKFVRNNHGDIGKVAAVTDSQIASILPKLVDHFISAEIRHFKYEDRDTALQWLLTGLAH